MCGRYNIASLTDSEMREILSDMEDEQRNKGQQALLAKMKTTTVARTDIAPVLIMDSGTLRAVPMTFGIPLPHGGVEPNARRETIYVKPSWRQLVVTSRGIAPCTSFYEWLHDGGGKATQMYEIAHADRALMDLACIYGHYIDKDGKSYKAFAVVTAPANDTIRELHDRMPVILKTPQDRAAWLGSDLNAVREILARNDNEKYDMTPIDDPKKKKQEKVQQIRMF